MRDTDLYARILGVERPWQVTDVELRLEAGEVEVAVEYSRSGSTSCPECGMEAARYDSRVRRWRHLPTCQDKTILAAEVPRVRCPQHGVKTLAVPWAEPGSGFTALLEALVIDWLREASIRAVARWLDLTWDEVDGLMQRAVRRGLARRRLEVPRRLGVDETSFQKRHEYVTVVADVGRGVVQHVADGRGKEALAAYYDLFTEEELGRIESVAMDMRGPYDLALGVGQRRKRWPRRPDNQAPPRGCPQRHRRRGHERPARRHQHHDPGPQALRPRLPHIYLHLGGLDLNPDAVTDSHS